MQKEATERRPRVDAGVAPPAPGPKGPTGRGALRWLALSTLAHLLLSLLLAFLAVDIWIPKKLDVVWLDLDNRLGVPRAAEPDQPPPRVEQPRPPAAKTAPKPPPAPRKMPPRRPPAPRRAQRTQVALDGFVPGDAALMLLVRTDRVRRSPYARTVRRLLEVFYDYKMLLWQSGLDPLQDFDALLIATPNPYRVTTTFLAGRFHQGRARIKRGISRAARHGEKRLRWSPHPLGELGAIPSPPRLRQDPRQVLLRAGLVMIVDPREMSALARPRDAADKAAGTTLVDRLHELDQQGGDDRRAPGLQLQAINLRRLLLLPPDLPPPLEANVTIPATAPALVRGRLRFRSSAEATAFYQSARARLEQAQRSIVLRLLGVGSLIGRIELKRRGARVSARATLSASDVRDLLEMFRSAIPQIHVPGMAPRRPETPPQPAAGKMPARPLRRGSTKAPAAPAAQGGRDSDGRR